MKYKCSSKNNYTVIGICDIKKFNEKISKFKDKSWTQITIPKKLTISSKNLDLKTITKCNINIKITSTKIISTPSSDASNIEGINITGKILLINGWLCQNVLYISDTISQSIHSVKFDIPFNTYIVIDKDVDIDNDTYCVYSCIENIFIKPLDRRTLINSTKVFLFAHRITQPSKPIENMPNAFIYLAQKDDVDTEIVRVEFDKANKKIIATSTGLSKTEFNPNIVVFIISIINSTDYVIKHEAHINSKENGDKFVEMLNGKSFEVGDIVNVYYIGKDSVILTNFPNANENYVLQDKIAQSFIITEDGIIKNVLPNKIKLNDANNEPIFIMEFDRIYKSVLVESTGNIANPRFANQDYFKAKFFTIVDLEKTIKGNEDASGFVIEFNSRGFDYNHIIKLEYKERNKVVITNFPDSKTPIYNPKGMEEYFEVTKSGLKPFIPPDSGNTFIYLAEKDNINTEMVRLNFDQNNKKIIAKSTGRTRNDITPDVPIFSVAIRDSNGTNKYQGNIQIRENGNKFVENLNDKSFEYGDRVDVYYVGKDHVVLTNFPNINRNYALQDKLTQSFIITSNGLIKNVLPNKIKLNDINGDPIFIIEFDRIYESVLVEYTGNIANPAFVDQEYFTATFDTIVKLQSTIKGNENGRRFENEFNSRGFKYNDVIKLEYKERLKVVITNFPDSNTPIYNPQGSEESFVVAENGLQRKIP